MHKTLPELVGDILINEEVWKDEQLTYEIKMFLWKTYDSDDELIYPVIDNWDDLLERAITETSYSILSQDEILSILFGLIYKSRIMDGLWQSMFERGVTQKLLARLLILDTDKS